MKIIKPQPNQFSKDVFQDRYALTDPKTNKRKESKYEQMWMRVAMSIANDPEEANDFLDLLEDFKFVPGGRILYAAGQGNRATLANCYVLGIDDTRESIFTTLGDSIEILAKGGGVGFNFSNIRPMGMVLHSTGGTSSGPCSFITLFNAAARTIVQGGTRHAAMMGQLNLNHPELRKFIEFKQQMNQSIREGDSREWNHFNVSVAINSNPLDFLNAVDNDLPWEMKWTGQDSFGTVEMAGDIWNLIIKTAWESGDPGLFFLQRAQSMSNTSYCEDIVATNPCGEIPLPDGGACFLGSMNIVQFMELNGEEYVLNTTKLHSYARLAVRFLDNAVGKNYFPTPRTEVGLKTRRIGLGIMGLADAAILANIAYDSEAMLSFTAQVYRTIRDAAYESSIEIAHLKGEFPDFDKESILKAPFIQGLPIELIEGIKKYGLRNGHLMTQAPTGTTSILAGVSSGIEPIFNDVYLRRDRTGSRILTHALRGHPAMRKANNILPIWHLRVQEVAQQFVDQSISKTINLPNTSTVDDVAFVYRYAFEHGFKGLTVFRDGCFDGVLYNVELCPLCEEDGIKTALNRSDGCTKCPTCSYVGSCDLK